MSREAQVYIKHPRLQLSNFTNRFSVASVDGKFQQLNELMYDNSKKPARFIAPKLLVEILL